MSGRTRSIPSMSSCGNIRPASTTRTFLSHSSAHMLIPTSPRPPKGMYLSRDVRGPRELTAPASELVMLSQKLKLLGFLPRHGNRCGRWRRGEQLVEVLLDEVEIVLQVGHQRAVVQGGRGVVQGHVRDLSALDQTAVDARYRSLARHQALERVAA